MAEVYSAPVPSVGVEITNRCNLSCLHCFNHSAEGKVQELSLADLQSIFDQVQAMGLPRIRISGGEPTLHPAFTDIVAEASRRNLSIILSSHGLHSARTQEQIRHLPQMSFILSLEGLRSSTDFVRGPGVFDRVVQTAAWLREIGCPVILGVHLRRSTIGDVEGLINLAGQLGVNIKFSPLRPLGRARIHLQGDIPSPLDFYNAVKTVNHLRPHHPETTIAIDFDILQSTSPALPPSPERACCPAGRSLININFDGTVYPCAFLTTPAREFAAGHIRRNSLLTIWQESPIWTPFRTLQKDTECQGCPAYGQECLGGCVAMSYLCEGRLDAHDPVCFIHHIRRSGSEANS